MRAGKDPGPANIQAETKGQATNIALTNEHIKRVNDANLANELLLNGAIAANDARARYFGKPRLFVNVTRCASRSTFVTP